MDLYEYQGKELFANFGIPVSEEGTQRPLERHALQPESSAARSSSRRGAHGRPWQGGRGQARREPDDAGEKAEQILGLTSAATSFASSGSSARPRSRRYYLSLTFDQGVRSRSTCSRAGRDRHRGGGRAHAGEAREASTSIRSRASGPGGPGGSSPAPGSRVRASGSRSSRSSESSTRRSSHRRDAHGDQPAVVTPEGEVKALDSKFTVDDAALFRHPDIAEMRDLDGAAGGTRGARERRHL